MLEELEPKGLYRYMGCNIINNFGYRKSCTLFGEIGFRLEINRSLTGSAEFGNKVKITNLSDTPITINYYRLVFIKRTGVFGWSKKEVDEKVMDIDSDGFKVDSHSSVTLHFINEDHFDWGNQVTYYDEIYLHLYIAGKKQIFKNRIYKNN